MKRLQFTAGIILIFTLSSLSSTSSARINGRETQNFNFNWKFHRGDNENGYKPKLETEDWTVIVFRTTGVLRAGMQVRRGRMAMLLILRSGAAIIREPDKSRPVTAGLASALMSNETGYSEALDVADYELKTTGSPSAIAVKCDIISLKPDREELSHIYVTLVDESGNTVYSADSEITCEISGQVRLIGMED